MKSKSYYRTRAIVRIVLWVSLGASLIVAADKFGEFLRAIL